MKNLHHDIFCRQLFDRIKAQRDGSRNVDDILNFFTDTEELLDGYSCLMDECESPIEKMFGAALLFATDGIGHLKYIMNGPEELPHTARRWATGHPPFVGTLFSTQNTIGKYRVDFLVATVCEGDIRYTAIECDGHDYHERTKEQASRDKKRDRAFVAQGIPVLRFTGSDIRRNLSECIDEVGSILSRTMHAMLDKKGRVSPPKAAA